MTSLWRHSRLTYYDLGPNILTQGVELLPGEVWQISKRNSQYFRSYLRKTTGGPLAPPPSGARVKRNRLQNYKLHNLTEETLKIWCFSGLKGEPGPSSPPPLGAPLVVRNNYLNTYAKNNLVLLRFPSEHYIVSSTMRVKGFLFVMKYPLE